MLVYYAFTYALIELIILKFGTDAIRSMDKNIGTTSPENMRESGIVGETSQLLF